MNVQNRINWRVGSAVIGLLACAGVATTSVSATTAPHRKTVSRYSTKFFHQIANIAWPAPYLPSASDDISWEDSKLHGYYLADRTNGGIDMVNTLNDTFGGVLGGFAITGNQTTAQKTLCGSAILGPNGVTSITVNGATQIWAGDGVTTTNPISSVKVFTMTSATSGTLGASVPTGIPSLGTTGTCRTDEIAADSVDNSVLAANNADAPPYISLITANANPSQDAVVGQIKFPTATGIEQPLYDAKTKMFYVNVDNVGLVVINPKTKAVVHTYVEPKCVSTGLVLNPTTQQLLVACGVNPQGSLLMNARNGKVITRFPQISGTDEEWYDPGMNLYFSASAKMTSNGNVSGGYITPEIGIISGGGTHKDPVAHWLGAIGTGATTNMKGVAVDATNHQVFSPAIGVGIIAFYNKSVFIGS